jgi:hypothetical protein
MTKRNLLKPRHKYATPKPGNPIVIGQWSLRYQTLRGDQHAFLVCPKGSGSSHWNSVATIYSTKGGCYIVSSNRAGLDAFPSWDRAVDEALRRAEQRTTIPIGDKYGETP